MADPISLGLMAVSLIGTVGQVAGGVSQANQSSKAYEEEAKNIQVQTALEKSAAEKQAAAVLGKNEARTAASGVTGAGSPLEYDLANAFNAGMDQANIQWGGDLKKRAAKMNASKAQAEGGQAIFKGLSQGGSILGDWYNKTKASTPTVYNSSSSSSSSPWASSVPYGRFSIT